MWAGELKFVSTFVPTKMRKIGNIVSTVELPNCNDSALARSGPRGMIEQMQFENMNTSTRQKWLQEAKVLAILGASARALPSVRSGLHCYLQFAQAHGCQSLLPPSLDLLLAWSTLFRCVGTWKNYAGYLRTVCLLLDLPVKVAIRISRIALHTCVAEH